MDVVLSRLKINKILFKKSKKKKEKLIEKSLTSVNRNKRILKTQIIILIRGGKF